jgi:hypothetical protein
MQNILNLSRLSKLFQMELRLHKKTYLRFAAVVFGLIIIQYFSWFIQGQGTYIQGTYIMDAVSPSPFILYASIMAIMCPFALYHFVYNPAEGLTYAMLPATSFEKFMSAWIQCVIVMPILLFGALLFGLLVGELAGFTIIWHEITHPDFLMNYLKCICVQSLALLGAFWFKSRKLQKTIITLLIIGLGIFIIGICIAYIFQHTFGRIDLRFEEAGLVFRKWGNLKELGDGKYTYGIVEERVILEFYAAKILAYLQFVIASIALWSVAFFKFRRTQI